MWLFDESYALLVRFHPFIMGMTFALSALITVQFLRFYQRTSDRLFLLFAAAFALMALNRIAFHATEEHNEAQPLIYVVRLIAFLLIIYAIIDKNRGGKNRKIP